MISIENLEKELRSKDIESNIIKKYENLQNTYKEQIQGFLKGK